MSDYTDSVIDSHKYDTLSLLPDKVVERLYDGKCIKRTHIKDTEWTAVSRAAVYFPVLEKFVGGKGIPLNVTLGDNTVCLYPHQLKALQYMRDAEKTCRYGIVGGMLQAEMGLGKTLMALAHICRYPQLPALPEVDKGTLVLDRLGPKKGYSGTLVVCSKTLLMEWKLKGVEQFFTSDEAPKVLYFHSMYMTRKEYISMTVKQMSKYDIVITTYEAISSSHKGSVTSGVLHSKRWVRVFWDESQEISNVKSKRYQASKALKYRAGWCLTGTPFRNDYKDIWAQLSLCGYTGCPLALWKNKAVLAYIDSHQLKRSMYSISISSAGIKLPSKTETKVSTILADGSKALELYETMKEVVRNDSKDCEEKLGSFSNVLAGLTTLRQICIAPTLCRHRISTMPAISKSTKEWLTDREGTAGYGAPKIKAIVKLVKATLARGEKALVFSTFSTAVELISEAINHAIPEARSTVLTGSVVGKKREEVLSGFREGGSNVLCLNYKIGATGLNLTEATTVISADMWWNNATHKQANARSWRPGQSKPVYMYSIFLEDSVDVLCKNVCDMKDEKETSLNTGIHRSSIVKICLSSFLKE